MEIIKLLYLVALSTIVSLTVITPLFYYAGLNFPAAFAIGLFAGLLAPFAPPA